MKRNNIKDIIFILFGMAFIIFYIGCIVIGCMAFFHAITNPELTLAQNFLWIFESKFRSTVVIGSIISYFGFTAIRNMK